MNKISNLDKKLLVSDLDNTLYDWIEYFVPSFYSMVDEIVRLTDCDREMLLDDFRSVHRKHHDSEHPFSLFETKTIEGLYRGYTRSEIAERLDPALYAFNLSRKQNLRLYPGVHEGLEALKNSGVALVAYTESKTFAALDRISRLKLDDFFEKIYCREKTEVEHPDPESAQKWCDRVPLNKVVELSNCKRKPNPEVLLEICSQEDVSPCNAAYVGDSIARDIMMAKDAGVYSIWAKYGTRNHEEDYRKLVRISHWTKEDIVREERINQKSRNVKADYVLEEDFGEIFGALDCKFMLNLGQ